MHKVDEGVGAGGIEGRRPDDESLDLSPPGAGEGESLGRSEIEPGEQGVVGTGQPAHLTAVGVEQVELGGLIAGLPRRHDLTAVGGQRKAAVIPLPGELGDLTGIDPDPPDAVPDPVGAVEEEEPGVG